MAVPDSNAMIDETYEFSAPRFFDFINGETEDDVQIAEHWFETALSYAPSPFMPKIKTGRSESVQIESLCDFSNADNQQKKTEGESSQTDEKTLTTEENSTRFQAETVTAETRKEEEIHPPQQENSTNSSTVIEITKKIDESKDGVCIQEKERSISTGQVSVVVETRTATEETIVSVPTGSDVCCTPIPQMVSRKEELPTNSKKTQTAKRIASLVRNPSALKTRNQSQLSQAKGVQLTSQSQLSQVKGVKPTSQSQLSQVKGVKPTSQSQLSHVKGVKPASARSAKTVKNTMSTSEFVQENQAIKRQKLDEGRSRQILNIRLQSLPHKSRPGSSSFSNLCSSTIKTRKEDRKVYSREQAAATPFVSTAELVKRFQSNTRDLSKSSLSHDDATSIMQRKAKLTLTKPVEPAFETSQRVRSVKMKSSAELEEEMMARIPKFKARPLNKKMLEAPTLPALPRSTPQLPEFQEFHLKTMERANQHAETSTVVSSTESSHQNQWNPHKLTEPKTPRLETSLRARPTKAKTTEELEQEELEKIPKFKARPLNKKIFESKGELGIYCNLKRQVTKPQEFHFATDDRIPPTRSSVVDMFDKLSLNSEPHHDHQLPRLTHPNPFHLQTEERGAEKERRFVVEVLQKQLEEEKARIPKATPYPYTTDYPVVPPKPEPKQCTKPEPFQLESLTRHEEELKREMEERQRMEREAAQMRIFKAQPILKEDPLPVPEKERKPLTEVQEFSLHVDHRAVDRAEFDKKIKEKEMMYKRYRDEFESAKQMEDEKALKQMRRTMVPHARPVPNFDNPFHPQKSSKETTKAKSPNLRVIRRKEKRRMTTGVEAATSAAASQMR